MSEYTFNTDYESISSLEQPQAEILAKWCRGVLNPKRVIDLGCGPGLYVHELLKLGINAIGYELDPRANNYEHVIHKNILDVEDTSDVVYCIEVAEHLEPKYSQDIVNKIYDTLEPGGTLIWCAAHLGQGGTDHINCRPIEYWQKKFISKGLIHVWSLEENLKSTIRGLIPHNHMGWFTTNLMIFYKEDFKDNPSTAGSLIGPNQK
jgi:SAM-dependent methyltransferase